MCAPTDHKSGLSGLIYYQPGLVDLQINWELGKTWAGVVGERGQGEKLGRFQEQEVLTHRRKCRAGRGGGGQGGGGGGSLTVPYEIPSGPRHTTALLVGT